MGLDFKNLRTGYQNTFKHESDFSSKNTSKILGFISRTARLAAIDTAMIGQFEILSKLVKKLLANLAA